MEAKEKICFIIGPIGDQDTDIRKRSDQILEHIITPTVEQFGYTAIRADKISEPGSINHKVIDNILNSDLVIADLSGQNANVFYELAIRHTFKKPFIQITTSGEKNPFDVFDIRTIEINLRDLDKVKLAKEDITNQIKSIEENGMNNVKTPISLSLELSSLNKSGDIVQNTLGELIEQTSSIQKKMSILESKISRKKKIILEQRLDYSNVDDFGAPATVLEGFIEDDEITLYPQPKFVKIISTHKGQYDRKGPKVIINTRGNKK